MLYTVNHCRFSLFQEQETCSSSVKACLCFLVLAVMWWHLEVCLKKKGRFSTIEQGYTESQCVSHLKRIYFLQINDQSHDPVSADLKLGSVQPEELHCRRNDICFYCNLNHTALWLRGCRLGCTLAKTKQIYFSWPKYNTSVLTANISSRIKILHANLLFLTFAQLHGLLPSA